jgi:hypothetical protein
MDGFCGGKVRGLCVLQRLDTVCPSLKYLGRASDSRFVVIEIRDFGSPSIPSPPPLDPPRPSGTGDGGPGQPPLPPLFDAGVFFSFFDFYLFLSYGPRLFFTDLGVRMYDILPKMEGLELPLCLKSLLWTSDESPRGGTHCSTPRDRRDPSSSHCRLPCSPSR